MNCVQNRLTSVFDKTQNFNKYTLYCIFLTEYTTNIQKIQEIL